MKYVIVSVIKGKAGELNERLRKEVTRQFGVRASTLPAHFTIKVPFDHDGSIEELKQGLRVFAEQEKSEPYQVVGYNHFDQRVIYMDVHMSSDAKLVHDRLIDWIQHYSYIECNKKDGKDKIFHITIASKKLGPVFEKVWNYVQNYSCNFMCNFDNICLYRFEGVQWVLEEEFTFNSKEE